MAAPRFYESGEFEVPQLQRIGQVCHLWREELTAVFERITEAHPPAAPVDLPSLADLLTSVFEGAYIVSRV